MKKRTKLIITSVSAALLLLGTLTACQTASDTRQPETETAQNTEQAQVQPEDIAVKDLGIEHEEEFGGVYALMTIDDLNAAGFEYGDSVDAEFSNGCKLEDIPYYNGYYTQAGQPLLVAYPGYPYIKLCINSGGDLYTVAGLTQDDTVTIKRAEKEKYLSIQNARDIHYGDERSQYASDEVFANFRAVSAGDMAEGKLYRSASPCDNRHNRAPYTDKLMGAVGVKTIIDLADDDEKLKGYPESDGFDSPNFLALYKQGSVVPLSLNMDYTSDDFRQKLAKGLTGMKDSPAPYLVHCTEGKDRTGFACLLLEALCGADYGEIVDDYMITYDNYYGINQKSDPERYDVIVKEVLEPMIKTIVGEDADLKTADYASAAKKFLADSGMTEEDAEALRVCLTSADKYRERQKYLDVHDMMGLINNHT